MLLTILHTRGTLVKRFLLATAAIACFYALIWFMRVNTGLRIGIVLAVAAISLVTPAATYAEIARGRLGDPEALWRNAATLRSELLAMLAAAERGEAPVAAEHARGATTTYARMSAAAASAAPATDRAIGGRAGGAGAPGGHGACTAGAGPRSDPGRPGRRRPARGDRGHRSRQRR